MDDQQIKKLAEMPDNQIDTSDIPETRDWSGAVRGKFYRGASNATRDESTTWTVTSEPIMFLVGDDSRTYKSYLERYKIYEDAQDAIKALSKIFSSQSDLHELNGGPSLAELLPEDLKLGSRFVYTHEYLKVFLIAIKPERPEINSWNMDVEKL